MHGLISFICLIVFILLSNSTSAQSVNLSKPVENWEELVRSSGVETTYQVKEGDNLYEISDILFGDAHYWPKVWSLNKSLTNPHEIKVGQIIYFGSGSVVNPPSISLDAQTQTQTQAQTQAQTQTQTQIQAQKSKTYLLAESDKKPIIPEAASRTLVRQLPPSLPHIFGSQGVKEKEEQILKNIEIGERLVLKQKEETTLYTEILLQKPKSIGKLEIIEDDSVLAKVGDIVVLSLNSSASIGQKLSVFDVTKSKGSYVLVHWLGEMKVIEQVGSLDSRDFSGNKDNKYTYKALVTGANQDIFKGASVSFESLKSFSYGGSTEKKPISFTKSLEILGGEGALDRNLFSEGDLIYLNRGLDDGVSIGDVYYVERSLEDFFSFTKVQDIPGSSAFVKVIAADERYATGVLYNVTNIISTGDKIRTKIH